MSLLFFSFLIAVMAYTYAETLTEGGMILSGWYRFLERKVGHLPWLFKPLIDCSKCVAGQMALWGFPLFYNHTYSVINQPLFYSYHYAPFEHLSSICLSIWMVIILKAINTKYTSKWLNS